ncbi:MAG: 3-methyl-2-oxobutanoate hydroxymethyltransferase [Clostridiales bacterium]|nr:3-methyl-2-oxobutanoate hydroxymethyltransferase [Clostridiales bacterium]
MSKRLTIPRLAELKAAGEKITMLTAYDYPTAAIADKSGIDLLLVGDSLGMVVLGHESTLPVTMEEILHHTRAVTRGAGQTLVVADLPFGSYQTGHTGAVANAIRLVKDGGADAVKLEGGLEVAETAAAIVKTGIPVMGHIGVTPQTAVLREGYKVQGRDEAGARSLLQAALALQEAGVFAVVLECVAAEAAAWISRRLRVPVIGIGSGSGCDGQVLVCYDMLGLTRGFVPSFVKSFADLAGDMEKAFAAYAGEVRSGNFPGRGQAFFMNETEARKLEES